MLNFIPPVGVHTSGWLCGINLGGRNTAAVTELHSRNSGQLKYLFVAAYGHLYLGLLFSPLRGFQWITCSTTHLLVIYTQGLLHTAKQKHFPTAELACLIMCCCEIQDSSDFWGKRALLYSWNYFISSRSLRYILTQICKFNH